MSKKTDELHYLFPELFSQGNYSNNIVIWKASSDCHHAHVENSCKQFHISSLSSTGFKYLLPNIYIVIFFQNRWIKTTTISLVSSKDYISWKRFLFKHSTMWIILSSLVHLSSSYPERWKFAAEHIFWIAESGQRCYQ